VSDFSFLPHDWTTLNTSTLFGVLLVAGVLGGLLAKRVRWLPTITGFMAVGLLIGPSGLGLLDEAMLADARVLVQVALGLILFKLGTSLHPWMVLHTPALLIASLVESVGTFAAIWALMHALGTHPLAAIIAATVAVSSSPAVLIHVVHELRAKGPVVDISKALVAMNNVLAFIFFSLAMPFALRDANLPLATAIGLPVYQMIGAALLGTAIAWLITRVGHFTATDDAHYRFALVVGGVMLTLGLSELLRVSPLFATLSLGIASRGLQRRARLAHTEFGAGADLFFIVLFVVAGASLHLHEVFRLAPLALAYVGVRVGVKVIAVLVCGKASGYGWRESAATGLTLIPMAGLAIGLVQTTQELLPAIAGELGAIVLAAVAVFETIGPPLVAYALRLGGTVPDGGGARQTAPATGVRPELPEPPEPSTAQRTEPLAPAD